MEGRLLLVSNRLPITIKRDDDGTYAFSMSSGGLVTGLSGLAKTTTFQWYGWPGLEVPDAERGPLVKQLQDEHDAVPIFVDNDLADRHYNGFSSAFPLFISKTVSKSLIVLRLYFVAPLPLPPWRDYIRRVTLGCI